MPHWRHGHTGSSNINGFYSHCPFIDHNNKFLCSLLYIFRKEADAISADGAPSGEKYMLGHILFSLLKPINITRSIYLNKFCQFFMCSTFSKRFALEFATHFFCRQNKPINGQGRTILWMTLPCTVEFFFIVLFFCYFMLRLLLFCTSECWQIYMVRTSHYTVSLTAPAKPYGLSIRH